METKDNLWNKNKIQELKTITDSDQNDEENDEDKDKDETKQFESPIQILKSSARKINDYNQVQNQNRNHKQNHIKKPSMTSQTGLQHGKKESHPMKGNLNYELKAGLYEKDLEENKVPRYIYNKNDISYLTRKTIEESNKYIKIYDSLLTILSLIAIVCSVIDQEKVGDYYSFIENKYILSYESTVCRFIIIIVSALSIYLLYLRYSSLFSIHKSIIGNISEKDSLLSSPFIKNLVFELIVHLVVLPPFYENVYKLKGSTFVEYNTEKYFSDLDVEDKLSPGTGQTIVVFYYSLSNILTIFILLRSYHVIRLLNTYSSYSSYRNERVCRLMNSNPSLGFRIKAYLKTNPFLCLGIAVFYITFAFGLSFKIFENYATQILELIKPESSPFAAVMKKFNTTWNCLWLVVVTMTTIGYGDIYPTTYFGRLLTVITCLFGTFILSLLVVFLNQVISLDDVEKGILITITENPKKEESSKRLAARMIYNSFLFNYLNNRRKDNTKLMRLKLLIDLEYDKNQFKIDRLSKRRIETDINELLDDIKFKFEESLVPFKKRLELFNKERIYNDHSLSILKDSSSLCESVIVRSRRVLNMIKAYNSQVFLGKIESYDEIYSCDSTFPEEVSEYFSIVKRKN